MIYGYVRVSTKRQLDGFSVEDQEIQIKERYQDCKIVTEAYSGAKARPVFSELIEEIQAGDLLVCTKLDRFCRTAKEGLEYVDYLLNKGISIHILNMGLIEDIPMGRLIVTNLLAFAEFERSMINERCQSGKDVAKTKDGFRGGRPQKYTNAQIELALNLLNDYSYSQVSKMTGISKSTLQRAKKKPA